MITRNGDKHVVADMTEVKDKVEHDAKAYRKVGCDDEVIREGPFS